MADLRKIIIGTIAMAGLGTALYQISNEEEKFGNRIVYGCMGGILGVTMTGFLLKELRSSDQNSNTAIQQTPTNTPINQPSTRTQNNTYIDARTINDNRRYEDRRTINIINPPRNP